MSRFKTIFGAGVRAVRIYDEQDHRANVDRVAEALTVIDTLHQRTHEGVVYSHNQIFAGVTNDADIEVLMQVPAGMYPHIRIQQNAGGDAEMRVFEGSTFSAAGTAVTPRNRNRNVPDASAVTLTHTPTITVPGTELVTLFVPGGSGGNASGANGIIFEEFILKPSTDYLFRGTNRAGIAQDMNSVLTWYEPNGAIKT